MQVLRDRAERFIKLLRAEVLPPETHAVLDTYSGLPLENLVMLCPEPTKAIYFFRSFGIELDHVRPEVVERLLLYLEYFHQVKQAMGTEPRQRSTTFYSD